MSRWRRAGCCLLALALGELLAGAAAGGSLVTQRSRAPGGAPVVPAPEAPAPVPRPDPLPPPPPRPPPPPAPTIPATKPQGVPTPAAPAAPAPPGLTLPPGAVPESTPTRGASVRPDVRAGLPGLGRRGPSSAPAGALEDWETWWRLERHAFLPARARGLVAGPVTPDAQAPGLSPGELEARQAGLARAAALPLLERLAGVGEEGDDVRASALLALARSSTAPTARALVAQAARDARAPDLVRESAALALGLFRRSDPAQQLAADEVERLREVALVLLDDDAAPLRTRCFAALALGLLGDQPFAASEALGPAAWVRTLWTRMARPRASAELPVALLVALGHQPPAGLLDPVREGLRGIVVGREAFGRAWSVTERAHALACLVRLAPGPAQADLLRVLQRRGEPEALVRAAALAAPQAALRLAPDARAALHGALARSLDLQGDPWTRGLLRLALGRVLAADLAAGDGQLAVGAAPESLLGALDRVRGAERGYAVLAVGLAARAAGAPEGWLRRVRARLLEGLVQGSEDPATRSACALALGLAGGEGGVAPLVGVVGDRDAPALLRGHGSLALALLEARAPEAVRAVVLALGARHEPALRASAALALGTLRAREALPLLLREAGDDGASEHVRAQAAEALGRLGDVGAVPALAALAGDAQRSEAVRAMALVALGLVLDPEPRPSLLRLSRGLPYGATTDALAEVLTIL